MLPVRLRKPHVVKSRCESETPVIVMPILSWLPCVPLSWKVYVKVTGPDLIVPLLILMVSVPEPDITKVFPIHWNESVLRSATMSNDCTLPGDGTNCALNAKLSGSVFPGSQQEALILGS